MKKLILLLFITSFVFSCSKKTDDLLIIPPNFAEMPDESSNENVKEENEKDIEKLREILLKS